MQGNVADPQNQRGEHLDLTIQLDIINFINKEIASRAANTEAVVTVETPQ